MKAVVLVRKGWSIRKAARYFGFSHGALLNWIKKAPRDGRSVIPTRSSAPKSHPNRLTQQMVDAIVGQRKKHSRCAKVVHRELQNQGIIVSLSSVERTLKRRGLIKRRSPWKRWHLSGERPEAVLPGDLVQIDTIHFVINGKRFYVYTIIDIASRWAYAKVSMRINTYQSLKFVREAQGVAGFAFKMIQSDNGPEFSTWFTEHIGKANIQHRHSRVRKSNDNAHIERFNRTLQEECLDKLPNNVLAINCELEKYLRYYNEKRLHMGIYLQVPNQLILMAK
jgi:transposase InsO family protein